MRPVATAWRRCDQVEVRDWIVGSSSDSGSGLVLNVDRFRNATEAADKVERRDGDGGSDGGTGFGILLGDVERKGFVASEVSDAAMCGCGLECGPLWGLADYGVRQW